MTAHTETSSKANAKFLYTFSCFKKPAITPFNSHECNERNHSIAAIGFQPNAPGGYTQTYATFVRRCTIIMGRNEREVKKCISTFARGGGGRSKLVPSENICVLKPAEVNTKNYINVRHTPNYHAALFKRWSVVFLDPNPEKKRTGRTGF